MKVSIFASQSSLFKTFWIPGLLSFLFPVSSDFFAQNSSQEKADRKRLAEILEKTGEYCRQLEKAALDFVCIEEVTERIDLSWDIIQSRLVYVREGTTSRFASRVEPVKTNKYRHDYQLIRKGGEIKESRILIEEDFQRKFEKDVALKTSVFTFNKFLFGPIAVLSTENHHYYDYQIIKEEMWEDEKVVLLEANPKPSLTQNIISGKIWVRERDFTILKMECNQKSIANFWILEERAKRYKADPEITTVAEYGLEKNAIRFPSRCFIEEAYRNKKGRKFVRSETTVVYKNYKFFTVETEIRFK